MRFDPANACSELAGCLVNDGTSIGELAYRQLLTAFAHAHPLASSDITFCPIAPFNHLELAFSLRSSQQRSTQINVALRDTAIADTETKLAALVSADLLQRTTADIPAFLSTLQRAATTDSTSEANADLVATYHLVRDHLPADSIYCNPLTTIQALLRDNISTTCRQYSKQLAAYAIHLGINTRDKSAEELITAITDWYTKKFTAADTLNTLEIISALANLKVRSVKPLEPTTTTTIDLTTIKNYLTGRSTETAPTSLPTTLFPLATPDDPEVAELHRELQRAAEAAGEYVFKQLEMQAMVIVSTHDASTARPYYSIILSWAIYRLHNETVCVWNEFNQLYALIKNQKFLAKAETDIKTELLSKFTSLLSSINRLISYINIAHAAIHTSGNGSGQTLELLGKLLKFAENLNDNCSKICGALSSNGIDIDPNTTKSPFTDIHGLINTIYRSQVTCSLMRRRLSSGARSIPPMLVGSPPGSPTVGTTPPDPFRIKAAVRAGATPPMTMTPALGLSSLFVAGEKPRPHTTRDASTQTPRPSTE